MILSPDAENWLKSNLNISVQDMLSKPNENKYSQRLQSAKPEQARGLTRYGSLRPEDLKHKSWAIHNGSNGFQTVGLTENNKAQFDKISDTKSGKPSKRPMSAATRTSIGSRMTNVPEVPRMKLMIIANDIYKNRAAISEILN